MNPPGSCVFIPRRKEDPDAEAGPLERHVNVSRNALERLFHLSLTDAARETGLCPPFNKACRKIGIGRWPYRKGQRRVHRQNAETQSDASARGGRRTGGCCSSPRRTRTRALLPRWRAAT
mmetsp:Transcript_15667/g.36531  ORF Transcript_15667/g.36531 Transcript_15667/m.36531 type:complete len:120 (+) Transcript_15667:23-382(+)